MSPAWVRTPVLTITENRNVTCSMVSDKFEPQNINPKLSPSFLLLQGVKGILVSSEAHHWVPSIAVQCKSPRPCVVSMNRRGTRVRGEWWIPVPGGPPADDGQRPLFIDSDLLNDVFSLDFIWISVTWML